MHHAFPEFLLHRPCVFPHPCWLVHKNTGLLQIKKLQEGHRIFIEIVDISVQVHQVAEFQHLLLQLFDLVFYPVGFLCMEFPPQLFRETFCLPFNFFHAPFYLAVGKQHLPCRVNCDAGKLFDRTLA